MEKIRCTGCKKDKPISEFYKNKSITRGYHHYCKECDYLMNIKYRKERAEWGKKHRKRTNKAVIIYYKKNPLRVEARRIFRKAVRNNIIKRKPCFHCGNVKSHGHHPDYSKPLEVIWVCALHHRQIHSGRKLE